MCITFPVTYILFLSLPIVMETWYAITTVDEWFPTPIQHHYHIPITSFPCIMLCSFVVHSVCIIGIVVLIISLSLYTEHESVMSTL